MTVLMVGEVPCKQKHGDELVAIMAAPNIQRMMAMMMIAREYVQVVAKTYRLTTRTAWA